MFCGALDPALSLRALGPIWFPSVTSLVKLELISSTSRCSATLFVPITRPPRSAPTYRRLYLREVRGHTLAEVCEREPPYVKFGLVHTTKTTFPKLRARAPALQYNRKSPKQTQRTATVLIQGSLPTNEAARILTTRASGPRWSIWTCPCPLVPVSPGIEKTSHEMTAKVTTNFTRKRS